MKLIESFVIAIRSLSANKLRASLTMLGIIIGVGAVITLMSIGRGAEATVTATFEELGANVIYIQPSNPDAPGLAGMSPRFAVPTLTLDDAEAIADINSVLGTAPINESFVEVVAGNERVVAVIDGSTPAYQQILNYVTARGQFISDRNVSQRDKVIVLGNRAASELFGLNDPVGQKVKVKGNRFTVIGVLEPKGGGFFGVSFDDVVVIPITTYQTTLFAQRTPSGQDAVQSINIQVTSAAVMDEVKEEVENILRKRHRITADEKDDFAIMTQEQALGLV